MAMDVNRNAPVVVELEVFTRTVLGTLSAALETSLRGWLDAQKKAAEAGDPSGGGSG